MARRKTPQGAPEIFPPPAAIPEPPETDRDRALRAETMRLLAQIKENLWE